MVWAMCIFGFGAVVLCKTHLHNRHTYPKQTNRHQHLFTNECIFIIILEYIFPQFYTLLDIDLKKLPQEVSNVQLCVSNDFPEQ